jgi:hypothetical protein
VRDSTLISGPPPGVIAAVRDWRVATMVGANPNESPLIADSATANSQPQPSTPITVSGGNAARADRSWEWLPS